MTETFIECDNVVLDKIILDMQCFVDKLLGACRKFGLTISLDKTVVMFQPAPRTMYTEPSTYVDGMITYLGITISRFCSHDDEIASRLERATDSLL